MAALLALAIDGRAAAQHPEANPQTEEYRSPREADDGSSAAGEFDALDRQLSNLERSRSPQSARHVVRRLAALSPAALVSPRGLEALVRALPFLDMVSASRLAERAEVALGAERTEGSSSARGAEAGRQARAVTARLFLAARRPHDALGHATAAQDPDLLRSVARLALADAANTGDEAVANFSATEARADAVDLAVEALRRRLRLRPGDSRFARDLARTLLHIGQPQEAARVLEAALARETSSVTSRLLAEARHQAGNTSEAVSIWEREGTRRDLLRAAAASLERGRLDDAQRLLSRIPASPEARLIAARLHLERGQVDEAQTLLESIAVAENVDARVQSAARVLLAGLRVSDTD